MTYSNIWRRGWQRLHLSGQRRRTLSGSTTFPPIATRLLTGATFFLRRGDKDQSNLNAAFACLSQQSNLLTPQAQVWTLCRRACPVLHDCAPWGRGRDLWWIVELGCWRSLQRAGPRHGCAQHLGLRPFERRPQVQSQKNSCRTVLSLP